VEEEMKRRGQGSRHYRLLELIDRLVLLLPPGRKESNPIELGRRKRRRMLRGDREEKERGGQLA
jgi:hypothetical protein